MRTANRSARSGLGGAGAVGQASALLDDSTIANLAPDLIISASIEGNITSLNPAFERLTGLPRDEWIGRNFRDLIHADDRAAAQAIFEAVLRFEEPPLIEVRLFTRSGALVSVEAAALPQFHKGNLVGVLGICRDTTLRRRAEDLLRSSERHYRVLFESNPLPTFILDGQSLAILDVNDAAIRLYGYSRDELLEMSMDRLQTKDQGGIQKGLHTHRTKSGALLRVEPSTAGLVYRGRDALVAVFTDVTEHLRTRDDLRAHARQQSAIAHLGGRALAGTDAKRFAHEAVKLLAEILDVAYCGLLESRDGGLVPRAWIGEKTPGVMTLLHDPHAALALTSNETIVVEDLRTDARFDGTLLRSKGMLSGIATPVAGRHWPFGVLTARSLKSRAFSENEVHFVQAVANEIGWVIQRHQEEAARRQLLVRLLSIQDEERKHIARELHDDVGQLVTGLKLGLEAEERLRASGGAPNEARIREIKRIANVLLERVRDLSTSLRPPMLDELGLIAALEWHFDRYTVQTGVRVLFTHSGIDPRVRSDLEAGVFRIVQEALTNVARHAHVEDVAVTLEVNDERLRVEIADRGSGFDPSAASVGSSGLAGARERARALRGQLAIETAPDAGVTIVAEMPLVAPAADHPWIETSPSSSPTITK